MSYYLYRHDGMSDQNRWHSREASKIKAFSGFWGRFQSPKKSNFIDDIAFLELKNDFRAVRWKKVSLLFSFLKIDKQGFLNVYPLKNFIELCTKEQLSFKKANISEKDIHISIWKIKNLRIGVEFCYIPYCDMKKIKNCKDCNEYAICLGINKSKKWRNICIFQQI